MSDADELILTWKHRLSAISKNINAFSEAESTKRIRIRVRGDYYTGTTAQRAGEAVAMLGVLLDDYLLLARVVDDAMQALDGSLFESRETRQEKALDLLEGASIARQGAPVPLQQRGLLGSATRQREMTPDALLAQMEREFGQARDTLVEIDLSENHGQEEIAALRQDYQAMEERASRLGSTASRPAFIDLPDMESDPLNARAGIESLRRGLIAWSESLDQLEGSRVAAESGLASATSSLAALRAVMADHADRLVSVHDLFGAGFAAPLVDSAAAPLSTIDMLDGWLFTLRSRAQTGPLDPVMVGLAKLHRVLEETSLACHACIAEAETPLAELRDLRGLFGALKAKDAKLNSRASHGAGGGELQQRITAQFEARPLDLEQARTLIKQYQELLGTIQ